MRRCSASRDLALQKIAMPGAKIEDEIKTTRQSLSMLTTHREECGRTPVAQINTPLEPSRAGGVAKRPLRRAIPGCRD